MGDSFWHRLLGRVLDDPLSRENKAVRASMDRLRRMAGKETNHVTTEIKSAGDSVSRAEVLLSTGQEQKEIDAMQQALDDLRNNITARDRAIAQELSGIGEQLGTAGSAARHLGHAMMAESSALATRGMATSDQVLEYIIPTDKDGLLRYLSVTEVFEDAVRELPDDRRRTLITILVRLDAELSGRQIAIIGPATTRPEFPVDDE